jgi:hypothetical protein
MRNVFNRIVMLVLSGASLAVGIIGLLLVGGLITPAAVSPNGVLLRQWRFFTQLNGTDATTATIVCVVLALVGIILLILEVLPGRREPAQFVVRQDGLGRFTVARSSVGDLIQYEAAAIPGVMETRQVVHQGRKGLRVRVRASIAPEAEAPKVGETLQERVQTAIQRHIGLPVAEVQVATQIEPFEQRGRRRRVQ